jgi:peptide/nickel transport system substrate-binding protein
MKDRILGIAVSLLLVSALMLSAVGRGEEVKKVELRVGLETFWEETFDSQQTQSGGAQMISCMFDNPLQMDSKGKVIPGIVEKWELAPDGLSWIFHLRRDVLFHDGSKLTAKDVVFSYERAVAEGAIDSEWWQSLIGKKPRIDITDDYTLRIYTEGPKPLFAIYSAHTASPACWIVPKAYIEKNGLEYFKSHPIGTGPYKFVRHVPGDLIEFEAWDEYWGGVVPDFKRVTTYLVPEETTRIAMMETGELDAIKVSMEGSKKLKEKGFTILPGEGGVAYVAFIGPFHSLAKGMPLSDVRVRQALSLATNRQEIIDTMFPGVGSVPAPTRMAWYNPDITDRLREKWQPWVRENYRYDVDEAKRLLVQAGYSDGFSFDMWIAPDTSADYLFDLGVVLANYWEKIGVHVNITHVDVAAVKARRHTQSSTELVGKAWLTGAPSYRDDTMDGLSHFTTDKGSMNLLVGSTYQAEADKLWAEGQSTMDPARKEAIVDRFFELSTSLWIGIPVVDVPLTFAFGPRVKATLRGLPGFLARSYADFKYTGVEP